MADSPRTTAPAADDPRGALLLAAARGDRAAYRQLYEAAAPQLLGLALRMLGRRDLAEEAVQDAFVAAWRHAGTFEPARGTAMAWLARILRNRCLDLLRRRGREAPLDERAIADWADPAPGPAEEAAEAEAARRLRRCLGELEPSPRRGVMLVYYGGATFEEAAAAMQAPLGTVKSWVRRSLARLRSCLER